MKAGGCGGGGGGDGGGEERGRDKRERQRVVGRRGRGAKMDECTAHRVFVKERRDTEGQRGSLSRSHHFPERARTSVCVTVRRCACVRARCLPAQARGQRTGEEQRCDAGVRRVRARPLSEVRLLRLTSCHYLQLERSQGGHCCSNSQQPSPWQRALLLQRLPQQLWSRSTQERGGVRKSGPQRGGPRPTDRPQGLSRGPGVWRSRVAGADLKQSGR